MFRVGQKVVCVDAGSRGRWDVGEAPITGRIYTIAEMFIDREDNKLVLSFIELRRTEFACSVYGERLGYRASRFRPLVSRKTDISIFTAMLNPSSVTADLLKIADFCRDEIK